MQYHRTLRVYDEHVLTPALKYGVTALLRYIAPSYDTPSRNDMSLTWRILVSRKVNAVEEHVEPVNVNGDTVPLVYTATVSDRKLVATLFGKLVSLYPSPLHGVLLDYVRFSGYDSVNEWVTEFCSTLSTIAKLRTSWLCKHYGKKLPHGKAKRDYVYLYVFKVYRVWL
mgnify:CR=1 FL=1